MSLINFKLTLICLSTLPLIIIAASFYRRIARRVQRDVKVKIAKINATLAENINGMKIIQIFNKEKGINDDFDAINQDYRNSSIEETHVYAIFIPIMNLAYSLSLALLLWFGGGDAIQKTVELGVLVAFITYTQQFFRPIMDLSEKFNILQSSMASAERIFMLLDEKSVIENPV
jgi:ABC-type multidrug transport system fused ATPase/permease subunit